MSENVSNYPLLGQHDQKDNYGIYLGQTKISISSFSTVGFIKNTTLCKEQKRWYFVPNSNYKVRFF